MSAVLDRQRQGNSTGNATRMIHIGYRETPTVALCGAKLKGKRHADDATTDCVVCADLDGAL